MNPVRGGLPTAFALAAAAAGTTWLSMLAWRGFTEHPITFLLPLLFLGLVVGVSGAVCRWARLSGALVLSIQVLLSGATVSAILSGSPVPVGPAWDRLTTNLRDSVTVAQEYRAPVPADTHGVDPLLLLGGLVCLLLVDLLACTLRRAPLAGLPLLVVYSVPVSLLVDGVSWWVFALTAGGFLLLLFLQENEQVSRWGRTLGSEEESDPTGFGVRTGAVRTTAGAVGGVATVMAIFLPLAIPTLDLDLLPGGQGGGGDEIEIENPMVDMRRDLRRGDDIPLIQVRTDDPSPAYLRVGVLNRFTDNEWSPGDRDIPAEQVASGEMPELVGVATTVPRREYRYDLTIQNGFRSIWLPTYAPISTISASGDWRYDRATMDFLRGEDEDLDTAGISYSMTGVELDLSGVDMSRAPSSAGIVSSDYLDLPDGLPATISNYAFQVTRNEPTRFGKAVALQQWFREEGGFQYDIQATSGSGADDLLAFLSPAEGGRVGYCEQFASAMAVLARAVGIPARVAIGFLEPTRTGPGTFQFSAWDLHAWPELFFPGSGWVRFEPTPGGADGRADVVPDYTTERIPEVVDPTDPVQQPSDDVPVRDESTGATPTEQAAADGGTADATDVPWLPLAGGTGGALLLAGLLLTPRTVRRARRQRRLAGGPEDAWDELRDTARDLGIPWLSGRSPRETGDALADHLGIPLTDRTPERPAHGGGIAPLAVEALDRIVRCVERVRYARVPAAPESLAADVETCVASLNGGAARSARRRAEWWPRSVLPRPGRLRASTSPTSVPVRYGGVVDHVG